MSRWCINFPQSFRGFAASTLRKITSFTPVLGLISPPSRPQGISAIVRVKDEETWLTLSIRSISTAVDEIIVGDNGSKDRTPEILDALKKELGNQLTVLKRPEADIKTLTNDLIDHTRFRWIIRWDADFVARTDGPCSILHLREWLLNLARKRYFFVHPRMVELCGDLSHQRALTPARSDCHCFTFSEKLRYIYNREGLEAPLIPLWYQVLKYETPTFFHIDVKPVVRMFLSFLWKQYLTVPDRGRFPKFEDYLSQKIEEEWNGRTLDEIAELWAFDHFRELVPYDRNRFGDYPSLLQTFLKNPKYRLLYKDGQIIGRQEPDANGSRQSA